MNTRKIIEYVSQCRWCNFKGEVSRDEVSKLELTALPFDDNKKVFVVGEVKFNNGTPNKFFSMPLAIKETSPDGDIAYIEDNGKYYTDALRESDFWSSFSKLINDNNGKVVFPNGLILENMVVGTTDMFASLSDEKSKALSVEQSNTTLKVGDAKLAFKLERMLDFSTEINSEHEMNEKLMRENADFVPKYYGGLVWRTPDGHESAGGIVQEFVKNKGDMWSYLQNIIQNKLSTNYLFQRDFSQKDYEEILPLIENLNKSTAQMNKVLSVNDDNSSFSPEPVDDRFIYNYKNNLIVLLAQAKKEIEENLHKVPSDIRKKVDDMLENWDEIEANFVEPRLDEIKSSVYKGVVNRVHGDYHLGQVMVTPEKDVKIIDFAGEPALPMSQRKQKHISVRDIAGMYRSINGYLGAVAVEEFAKQASTEEDKTARKTWGHRVIKPLIDKASKTFLGDFNASDPWLKLEILRKNLYEVKYEVAERPEMLYVPVKGLSELFVSSKTQAVNDNNKNHPIGKAE